MTETALLRASSHRAWIAVAIATATNVAALIVWLLVTPAGQLREQLKVLQPWSLDVCVLLGLLVCVWLIGSGECVPYRAEIPRMAILAALGVALTLFVAPRTNRIFYDEQIYQGIGQNIADVRLAQVCHDGSVEYGRLHCASGEYNKQPYAYPHLLSLAYRIAGVHPWTAFAVNATVMGLTVAALYLLVCVLFRDRDAALFAGLLMLLTPQQLLWSATAAVEPSASMALVVALLGAAHYLRAGGRAAMIGAMAAASYAIQFRPESVLIVPIIAFMIWPRLREELDRPGGWWAANLFLWLIAVHAAHLFAIRQIDWGTVGPRFSFRYIGPNARVNGWFYLYDQRFPVMFSALAVGGLASIRRQREGIAMAMYFVVFFVVGLLFYAGSYNYGADVRYSLMTYPPVAALGGVGAARLARMTGVALRPRMPAAADFPARALLVTFLLFQFLWYAPVVRATTEEAWAARADVRFAESFARAIPRNSYVLTHNPSMFHIWGVNAGQMSLVTSNPEYLRFLTQRYSGGVYLHWNFWCNVQDPLQPEVCRKSLAAVETDTMAEYRERDQRFAFFRVKVAN